MSTTRTAPTTPRHDGRHCGHVARSESPTVKRAAILAECLAEVPGFTLPQGEPVAVLAVVEAITAGTPCDTLGEVAALAEWHGDALAWQDHHGDAFLLLPSLSLLTVAAATVAGVR